MTIRTLANDGCAVTYGTERRGLGGLQPRPVSSSLYQMQQPTHHRPVYQVHIIRRGTPRSTQLGHPYLGRRYEYQLRSSIALGVSVQFLNGISASHWPYVTKNSALATYGLNSLCKRYEHPTYTPSGYFLYLLPLLHCVSSCSFDKHGLILIISGQQHQHTSRNYMHIQLSSSLYFYLLYLLLNSCDEKKADAVCQKLSKLVHVVKTTACHSRCVFLRQCTLTG